MRIAALRGRTLTLLMTAAVAAVSSPLPLAGAGQRFYPDDPLQQEPETQDASGAAAWEIDLAADLLLNTFGHPGDPRPIRAANVNTIDEVPDSGWFTNRLYARQMSRSELLRGPATMDGPAPGRWTVIRPKTSGYAPGFTVRDTRGDVWFLTFDPRSTPNAATGAIAVAVRLFWALGYNQVESYLATLHPDLLAVDEDARIEQPGRPARAMTRADVDDVLDRAARNADGSYRVLAGRLVPGRVLGGFRYHGTRPDDPNDLVPHEHRRELRALKVFGAWTNLVDIKAGNTLDTVVEAGGRSVVRHYLQDVGSTFGTGAQGPREWDEGWEYLYDASPLWRRLVTLGFYRRHWQTASYADSSEVGRFEGDAFDPLAWKPRVPAAALLAARDDDTFWAALRVTAFTDEMIRAVAATARYDDPAATALLADVLIKRRDKIARAYLPRITPLVRFELDDSGTLTFENAAVRHGVARSPAGGYRAEWSIFDNVTGTSRPLQPRLTESPAERLRAPAGLPEGEGAFVHAAVSAVDPEHPAWREPVQVYFRRTAGTWRLVGLERIP